MEHTSNFDFDVAINKILPASQITLWELYRRMKSMPSVPREDDLYGEQIVVDGTAIRELQISIHPIPKRDEYHNFRAATLSQPSEEMEHELWCSPDGQTLELRGTGKPTEHLALYQLSHFTAPEAVV